MKILEVRPIQKNDMSVRRNPEVVPKSYFHTVFEYNEKTYTAAIRISTYHIAECMNAKNEPVRLREETERVLIDAIKEYTKKQEI